jgi:predicted MFS family arabinose efflux permease
MAKTTQLSRAPSSALAAVGVFWGTFAAYVPDLKAGIAASDAAFGLALMMSAVGGITAMAMAPRVMALLGRFSLPVAAVLLAVAAFYPLAAKDVFGFGIAICAVGASVSLLDICGNVRISVLEERHNRHLMNFSHAMFSFAFAASAFLASVARKSGFGPEDTLPAMGIVVLLLGVSTFEGSTWQSAQDPPEGSDRKTPWGPIIATAAILFAAFMCENASETWSALHIERTLGGQIGDGGFGPVALGLMMGTGRLCGQFAAARLGEAALVLWSAAFGVMGAIVLAIAPSPLIAILGVGLLGLGVAVVVPSANSILGRLVRPDQRSHAISRAWMIGFTGFFIGPPIVGFISGIAGLRLAFAFVAVVMATIIPCVIALRRRGG